MWPSASTTLYARAMGDPSEGRVGRSIVPKCASLARLGSRYGNARVVPRFAQSSSSTPTSTPPEGAESSLARPPNQLLDRSWESSLEVQHLGPKRRDLDTSHLLVHRAHLRLKRIPLVGSDSLSRRCEVFGWYAIHDI